MLRTHEDRTLPRPIKSREFQTAEVAAAVKEWTAGLDQDDPQREHLLLEKLCGFASITMSQMVLGCHC